MAIVVVMVGVFCMVLDGADWLLAPLFLLPFLRICPPVFPGYIDTLPNVVSVNLFFGPPGCLKTGHSSGLL